MRVRLTRVLGIIAAVSLTSVAAVPPAFAVPPAVSVCPHTDGAAGMQPEEPTEQSLVTPNVDPPQIAK